MKKNSKKYRVNKESITAGKRYSYKEALDLLLGMTRSKFDESLDAAIRLGVDPKQSDQQVRGAVVLPHGTGKKIKIIVFAKGKKASEAEKAGADVVGAKDLVEKIQKGWLDFDKVIATPDMMGTVSKLGKILGPKGLMPNPKMGTVTFEVADAIQNERKGKIEFKVDKAGIIHTMIGKASFGAEKLRENFKALIEEMIRLKPSSSKGIYLKTIALSTTHSPGILIDANSVMTKSKEA